jgi:hypothetical protein
VFTRALHAGSMRIPETLLMCLAAYLFWATTLAETATLSVPAMGR